MPSKVINITLPERLLQQIDRAAKQEERSRSEFFREAVRRYLEGRRVPFLSAEQAEVLQEQLNAAGPRTSQARERSQWAALGLSSLNRIWDNEKDAAYDNWRPNEG